MLLTAVVPSYNYPRDTSLDSDSGDKCSYWRDRLLTTIESLQRSPTLHQVLRCYQASETIDTAKSMDDPSLASLEENNFQGGVSIDTATSFRPDVRSEWIHAVFGCDFPQERAKVPPRASIGNVRQGVGLANIPSYVAYDVTIPANVNGDKLGITLSRMPLGLYVRSVRPGSEAWCAGVKPNSVLVEINGMAMLAEPSKKALERIWQYEGQFEDDAFEPVGSNATSNNLPVDNALRIRDPVRMTFILHGELYSVIFLSIPPYGIDWSPCGNFALVKRAYAFGAEAGVKRGSIVAAVADKTIHDLDHTTCAAELRKAFASKMRIDLQLCFPPSAARPSHFERQVDGQHSEKNPSRPAVAADYDGIEVRIHPLLWNHPQKHFSPNSVAKLACRVAAGEIYSIPLKPYGKATREHIYRSCPPLVNLLDDWDPIGCLAYCARYQQGGYNEMRLSPPSVDLTELLRRSRHAGMLVRKFLLQFFSLIIADDKHEALRTMLLKIACSDVELARQMELVAQSFDCESFQICLVTLREEQARDEQYDEREMSEQAPATIPSPSNRLPPRGPSVPLQLSNSDVDSIMSASSSPTVNSVTESPARQGTRRPRVFGFFRKKKRAGKGGKNASKISSASTATMSTSTISSKPLHSAKESISMIQPPGPRPEKPLSPVVASNELQSPRTLFLNTISFVRELEKICQVIEGSLLRSFSQKVAEWALQPWTASKGTVLAKVTQLMRERLTEANSHLPLLNPIDTESEILASIDAKECYILPSAHFPLLLTFDYEQRYPIHGCPQQIFGPEKLYRTKVELVSLRGNIDRHGGNQAFVVHGAVSGAIAQSGRR